MRIPEENCNMILLAAVTLVSVVVAGAAELMEPPPTQATVQATRATAQATPAYLTDTTPVRVVGGVPFVPNTDPHRR